MNDSTVEEIVNKTLDIRQMRNIEAAAQMKSDIAKMAIILGAVYVVVKVRNVRRIRKIRNSK
jgi:hypothetical protein